MNHYLSRRSFISRAAMVGGGVILSNSLLGKIPFAPANERVNLACIGVGNRAGEIIRDLYKTGLCNIVALCDVDMNAPHTQQILKMFPDVPRFQDFRQMFDKMGNQIDNDDRFGIREARICGEADGTDFLGSGTDDAKSEKAQQCRHADGKSRAFRSKLFPV